MYILHIDVQCMMDFLTDLTTKLKKKKMRSVVLLLLLLFYYCICKI